MEADEYDTAFFDKRAKFVHYRPEVAILNNLEFDHADIYEDVKAIQTQFHHLIRTIPGKGTIISNGQDAKLESVLDRGCWSHLQRFSMEEDSDWQVQLAEAGRQQTGVLPAGKIHRQAGLAAFWSPQRDECLCRRSRRRGCRCFSAFGGQALATFKGVKRRMELVAETDGIRVYDDFAHHPTAIRLTLEGLRRKVGNARVLVALEPRSNTMRAGVHISELGPALMPADRVWLMAGDGIDWDPQETLAPLEGRGRVVTRSEDMLAQMLDAVQPGDHVIFMSNGGFDSAPLRFCRSLKAHEHH